MTTETIKPVCDCTPEGDIARDRRPALHQEHCALLRWKQTVTDPTTDPMTDPTTEALEGGNAERTRLRGEVLRLSKALVAAYTDVEAVSADRDRLGAEVARLKKIGDTMFVEGYDQAVGEIRDHFRKVDAEIVAKEIEKIWLKDKLS